MITMWMTKSDPGYYTVYYCPVCKRQMTWHSVNRNIWKCDMCGLEMVYKYSDGKLHLK